MYTRIVLITLMAAAFSVATSLSAAPPRFSGYGTPHIPKKKPDETTKATEKANEPAADQTTKETQPTDNSKVEYVDGKIVVNEPATQANSTQSSSTETTATAAAKPADPPKKREPLFRLFKRKPIVPKEKTIKQNEELVTTHEYHETKVEQLGVADLHRFSSGYREFWKVQSSTIMCSMKQNIPGYGHVEFRQGVGQPLEFALYVTYPPAGVGRAHIRTEPPEWRHFSRAKDLGVIEIEPGDLAVSTPPEWAQRLLLELSEGMQPVMRYWDAADATDEMEVLLSSLNFQESLDLFNRCLGQVLRYDFDAVKRTIVHFHADSSKLRASAGRQLDEILEMLNADPGIDEVNLELYTHSKGLVRYNFRLATRRARAVRDYFIERGIPEDKIIIKIHTHKKSKLDEMGYKQSDVHIALKRGKKKK